MHSVFVDVSGCDTCQLLPIAPFSQPAQKSARFGTPAAHGLRCQTANIMHPSLILLAHFMMKQLGTGPGLVRRRPLSTNEPQKHFDRSCVRVSPPIERL